MPHPGLDRQRLIFKPLRERKNRVHIEQDHVSPDSKPAILSAANRAILSAANRAIIRTAAARIRKARQNDRPVILAFGAHAIKNGLAPVFIRLLEQGWITHLATNGAGIIHDWEIAFQGATSEDVAANVAEGQFGLWEETGFHINLALLSGALEGLGYGESVGALIFREGIEIPSPDELARIVRDSLETDPDRSAAAADLLNVVRQLRLSTGRHNVPHPFKAFSVQAAAYRLKIPFTGHPMIGHDIIYTHPMNHGAAVGRTALRDFLSFAHSVSRLEGGVYLSVGSAVMSPMIFEKSLSMARNLARQNGEQIDHHFMLVVDLAQVDWDWASQGEPPPTHPAYYLRYCKTFSRMGGTLKYLSLDNRDFLLSLWNELKTSTPRP